MDQRRIHFFDADQLRRLLQRAIRANPHLPPPIPEEDVEPDTSDEQPDGPERDA